MDGMVTKDCSGSPLSIVVDRYQRIRTLKGLQGVKLPALSENQD